VEIIYSDLMSVLNGTQIDLESPLDHANLGRQFLKSDESIVSFGAKATTLNQILVEAAAPACIDFLSLDVEGAELEVIKGVDYAFFRFKYICVEARNFNRVSGYLKSNGYPFLDRLSEHDYLFTDRS
jgi:hypothetical protein